MDSLVTIRGNVGSPVSFRCGDNEGRKWARAEFRVASTRRMRRGDGTWVDAGTTWISVEAWAALAEGVRGSLDKGDPVLVCGRLRTDEWADSNGQLQSRLVLAADAVGHDLSRGRTRFRKNEPIPAPEGTPAQAADDLGTDPGAASDTEPEDELGVELAEVEAA